MIEDFGPRVANVWSHLRTTTRNLVERAWQSPATVPARVRRATPYDPRADQELSQLLAALDEHAGQVEQASGREGAREARRLADACANVLSQQTQSAEVFAQLIERAHQRKDYAKVDALAELLPERLAPSEMAELGRAGGRRLPGPLNQISCGRPQVVPNIRDSRSKIFNHHLII